MEYLVTGGAGFIGSHLVEGLIDQGHEIIVIDDFSSGKKRNLARHEQNGKLHIYEKNICDDLNDIFQGRTIEVVFHLAALPKVQRSLQNPLKTHNVNINGTLNMLLACKKFGVKKFIFASSCAIYGEKGGVPLKETMRPDPLSPYALHKIVGEQYCRLFNRTYGIRTIILRYFNVFGPRQNAQDALIPKFITLVEKGVRPNINGDGKQTRDFIYVSDVVNATMLAAHLKSDSGEQILNIASGKSILVNKVAKDIIALRHSRINKFVSGEINKFVSGEINKFVSGEINKFVSGEINKFVSGEIGSAASSAAKAELKPRHAEAVIETRHVLADIAKAKKILEWEPKVSFEEGLKRTYDSFSA